MEPCVGVLALQGAFAKHIQRLQALGVKTCEVRKPADLVKCDALVIPGGESTTIMKQMEFIKFHEAFSQFAAKKPVFGTCAGIIIMSHEIIADARRPFNLLDIVVERNAFGRQVESFNTEVDLQLDSNKARLLPAVFIRAPKIKHVGPKVKVLASYKNEPVLVQQGHHLGATFHPELTDDPTVHAYFLNLVKN